MPTVTNSRARPVEIREDSRPRRLPFRIGSRVPAWLARLSAWLLRMTFPPEIDVVLQVVIPVAGLVISIIAMAQARTQRGIFYALTASMSLKGIKAANSNLPREVTHLAASLSNPHLLFVSLCVRGVKDIRPEDFSGAEPLILGLGARTVTVLRVDAEDAPKPDARKAGKTLAIYPSLLRTRKRLLFEVLVDGTSPELTCEMSPLADVRLKQAPPDEPGPIVQWIPSAGIFGAFLAFVTYPDGNITGWLVGVIASATCIWILVFVQAGKVIRKIREVRDIKRRISPATT